MRLSNRFKSDIWAKVAEELAVPWRAAEAMHWELGEADMARRAGVLPFSLTAVNTKGNSTYQNSPLRPNSERTIKPNRKAGSPQTIHD